MPSHVPQLQHAVLTDVGRKRLANEDAVSADTRLGLFVVCDGVGGRPSGEAASQIVSHTLAHALRRRLRGLKKLDEELLKKLLFESAVTMNEQMYLHSQAVPALVGMGCTMCAALFDARTMFYMHAGDSRIYLLRDGQLMPLTRDHTHTQQKFKTQIDTGDLIDVGERRLLMEYIGSPEQLNPTVDTIPLQAGDRVLLCSDGLTDPVDDDELFDLLSFHADPAAAAQALVETANNAGGPDNITVAVIDYEGYRPVTAADRVPPTKTPPELPHGIAGKTRDALALLEADLNWLKQGALESAHPKKLTALAAAKRRLGTEAYREFLVRHPNQSASHVFHQCCTNPESDWRKQYQAHLAQLEVPLARITAGGIRLSPVLKGDETARIYRDLWNGWRRVEQRYFFTCQRDAIHDTEQTLNILIDHMLHSVQTLTGLLYFLPRFMRESRAPRAETK
ncbi:PP2C family protein-serine/threonine phosphatase [Algisphaera agarilytica]|uniref:Serine/threonine protein phosphatase PrpC n=1 Tax=Algisphaera agarilytica TaxID=1385975 RepID=A0A7X0LKK8_9BACT|nr:protein phosphatase 2C domain-containing protein [Algisphaera agarilytica]MBB6429063.1 serine/threonine protein phosphatase PrpC [Algisphaera agarilytica]